MDPIIETTLNCSKVYNDDIDIPFNWKDKKIELTKKIQIDIDPNEYMDDNGNLNIGDIVNTVLNKSNVQNEMDEEFDQLLENILNEIESKKDPNVSELNPLAEQFLLELSKYAVNE